MTRSRMLSARGAVCRALALTGALVGMLVPLGAVIAGEGAAPARASGSGAPVDAAGADVAARAGAVSASRVVDPDGGAGLDGTGGAGSEGAAWVDGAVGVRVLPRVVLEPAFNPIAGMRGRVRVFDRLTGELQWEMLSPRANDLFGIAGLVVPDVDGDGVRDVVISAPASVDGQGGVGGTGGAVRGIVYVLSGIDGAVVRTFAGEPGSPTRPGETFGVPLGVERRAGDVVLVAGLAWKGEGSDGATERRSDGGEESETGELAPVGWREVSLVSGEVLGEGLGVHAALATARARSSVARWIRTTPPGDLNADGVTDILDLLIVLDRLGRHGDSAGARGREGMGGARESAGDMNGDGVVDLDDVLLIMRAATDEVAWDGGIEESDLPVMISAGVACGCGICPEGLCLVLGPTYPVNPDPWDDGEGEEEGGGGPPSTCIPPGSCECADADGDGILNYADCDSPCYVGDPATDCQCQDDDDDGTINQDECFDPCGGARSAPGECVCAELGVGVSIDQACEGGDPLVYVRPDGAPFPQPLVLAATGEPPGGTFTWTIDDTAVAEFEQGDTGSPILLTMFDKGEALIEVTYSIDIGGARCTATSSIQLSVQDAVLVCAGDQETLTAPSCPDACEDGCSPDEWMWLANPPNAVEWPEGAVGGQVLVHYLTPGRATISATNGCCTVRQELRIAPTAKGLIITTIENDPSVDWPGPRPAGMLERLGYPDGVIPLEDENGQPAPVVPSDDQIVLDVILNVDDAILSALIDLARVKVEIEFVGVDVTIEAYTPDWGTLNQATPEDKQWITLAMLARSTNPAPPEFLDSEEDLLFPDNTPARPWRLYNMLSLDATVDGVIKNPAPMPEVLHLIGPTELRLSQCRLGFRVVDNSTEEETIRIVFVNDGGVRHDGNIAEPADQNGLITGGQIGDTFITHRTAGRIGPVLEPYERALIPKRAAPFFSHLTADVDESTLVLDGQGSQSPELRWPTAHVYEWVEDDSDPGRFHFERIEIQMQVANPFSWIDQFGSSW